MLGLLDHTGGLKPETGDIISRLVRDFGRLSSDVASSDELFAFYPEA